MKQWQFKKEQKKSVLASSFLLGICLVPNYAVCQKYRPQLWFRDYSIHNCWQIIGFNGDYRVPLWITSLPNLPTRVLRPEIIFFSVAARNRGTSLALSKEWQAGREWEQARSCSAVAIVPSSGTYWDPPDTFAPFPEHQVMTELHGKGYSPPLPSKERVHSGSRGHRATFLFQGWYPSTRQEEGGGLTLLNSPFGPRRQVDSTPWRHPSPSAGCMEGLGWLYLQCRCLKAGGERGSSLPSHCHPAPEVQGSEGGWGLIETLGAVGSWDHCEWQIIVIRFKLLLLQCLWCCQINSILC